ncbi:MAG: class I SAM-dependent methyltransferase [Candidatus Moraniibacteriota bacterium]
MSKLVNDLVQKGYLKSERIIDAFSEISRIEFVPDEFQLQAEADVSLPVGFGQMIPSPMVAAMMLELLEPREGNRVLDAAFGTGWLGAILAYVVGEAGKVVALEKNAELKEIGKYNVEKFGYVRKGIVQFPEEAQIADYLTGDAFDRILLVSGLEMDLAELKSSLKVGGKMVICVRNDVTYFEKKAEDEFLEEKYSSFSSEPILVR